MRSLDALPRRLPRPRAPGALLLLLEARAPLEYAASIAAAPLLARLPRGDGHPVVVFPGLGAPDLSTLPLRRFLHRRGYTPYGWGQGLNLGPRADALDACRDRVAGLARRHGSRISLVGWSLGGLYARELAKDLPDATRCVVTLGAPFGGDPKATNAWRLFEWLAGRSVDDARAGRRLREPPPCPTTSIYSRSDGIVAWHCSLNDDGPRTENIAVVASHVGMAVNPLVQYAVADRLAQDPADWRRFDAGGARRWFYAAQDRP